MIDIRFTQFFDRKNIIAKVGVARVRVLGKFGSFIRRTAKGLLSTKGKKPAKPGRPPKSHVGLLKDLLFFAYDDQSESVVIGPQLLNGSRKASRRGGVTIPNLLEEGGATTTDRGKPAFYRKFPYMAPALAKERPKFADMFVNSVK